MDDFLSDDPSNGFEEGLEGGLSEDLSKDLAAALEDGFGAGLSVDFDEALSEYFDGGLESDLSEVFLGGLEDGRDAGRSEDLVSSRSAYPDDGLSVGLEDGFEEALVLGFSSPSWKFLPAGFPVLFDFEGAFGFLMNLEKSPCLLDFPPGTRGFSESFIIILNWLQR